MRTPRAQASRLSVDSADKAFLSFNPADSQRPGLCSSAATTEDAGVFLPPRSDVSQDTCQKNSRLITKKPGALDGSLRHAQPRATSVRWRLSSAGTSATPQAYRSASLSVMKFHLGT